MPLAGDGVFAAVRRFYDAARRRARAAHRRRHHERAARREPGAARRRRSAAHVHVPLAVRLPRRRRDREPDAARRARPIRGSSGGRTRRPRTSRDRQPRSRRCRCSRRSSPPKSCSGSDRLDAFADGALRRRRVRPTGCPTSSRSGSRPTATRWCSRCTCRSPRSDDVELGRRDDELFIAVGPHRRASCCPTACAGATSAARASTATASKWSSWRSDGDA